LTSIAAIIVETTMVLKAVRVKPLFHPQRRRKKRTNKIVRIQM
jgi:hypothetical protein